MFCLYHVCLSYEFEIFKNIPLNKKKMTLSKISIGGWWGGKNLKCAIVHVAYT